MARDTNAGILRPKTPESLTVIETKFDSAIAAIFGCPKTPESLTGIETDNFQAHLESIYGMS